MKNRHELHKLLKKLNVKIGVELGVAQGYYSSYLIKNHNFNIFFCIDKWNDHHDESEKSQVINNFKENNNIKIIHDTFSNASSLFEDEYFDFIYIDGYAHTGQDNGETLKQWYPKLKIGGIFAGHDYCQKFFPKTVEQVNLFLRDTLKYKIHTTKEERFPSWYILKKYKNIDIE
jgi:predicted O-methyltransferase YrrM